MNRIEGLTSWSRKDKKRHSQRQEIISNLFDLGKQAVNKGKCSKINTNRVRITRRGTSLIYYLNIH